MKYILNKLTSNLQLIAGNISIPPGQCVPISDSDSEHYDVDYAVSRSWASLHDKLPKAASTAATGPKIHVEKKDEGMTIEQIKELQAERAKNSGAKSERLGTEENTQPVRKASSTKLGDVTSEISAEDLRSKNAVDEPLVTGSNGSETDPHEGTEVPSEESTTGRKSRKAA